MFLRVESSSGVPVVRQIADQIRGQCASGALSSGDKLPSVRQLAKEILVNQNTILRVYERLTAEGLLETRHGDGTYVADRLPRGQARVQQKLLEAEVDRLVHRAMDLGVEPGQIRRLVDESIVRLIKTRPDPTGDGHE